MARAHDRPYYEYIYPKSTPQEFPPLFLLTRVSTGLSKRAGHRGERQVREIPPLSLIGKLRGQNWGFWLGWAGVGVAPLRYGTP